jgi:tripartite-type tricarboxylate transporter receptor subunit TctC
MIMEKGMSPLLSRVLAAVVVLAGWSLAAGSAQSEVAYPNRTIRFIVPYPPGGLPDVVARIVARRLQEGFGQSIIVENRAGANGGIAAAALTASPADGYTFMVTDGTLLSINPLLYRSLPYPPRDIAPVALLARAPLFLAVHASIPVTTMGEFIEYAKARPGRLNYGSPGIGSIHQLAMEATKGALELNIVHIPFKGTAEAVQALLGGHVDTLYAAYPALSGSAEVNRFKLLATSGAQRSPQAPNLPAVAEFVPGFDFAPIIGIYARAGTDPAVLQRMATEAARVATEDDVTRELAVAGVEAAGAGSAAFEQALDSEIKRVGKAIAGAGLKPE